jgi:hypothetical protein
MACEEGYKYMHNHCIKVRKINPPSDLSVWIEIWTLIGCCIFAGFTLAWRKVRRWGAATPQDGVDCQTMANHKGGVGKTTVSLLLAKQLAADPAQNVLVVDCSLYGDISHGL